MIDSCACNCQRGCMAMLDESVRSSALVLDEFVPFRLNRLADAVSVNLSDVYRERFGLEIAEWRVLVTVGDRRECTAQHIAASTRMHKTRVSRAVTSLARRKLVARTSSDEDGRELTLELTTAGSRMYAAIVPRALDRERRLLSCLSESQRRAFLGALTTLVAALELKNS